LDASRVAHEVVIEPEGAHNDPLVANGKEAASGEIPNGEARDLVWTFAGPGSYQFTCYVADHDQHGMQTAFTVFPPEAG
jgi:uncharacterized cupredoxin-like copper-binding protein